MKTKLSFISILLIAFLLLQCTEEENFSIPKVTTSEVSNILANAAITGGLITDDGGYEVISSGICWGIEALPTIDDSVITNEEGLYTFSITLTKLKSNTTYFIRAFATNKLGTAYGNEVTFKTSLISRTESISLGASYVNDIYYSLENGVVAEVPRASWDVAFSVSTRSSSLLINEGSGVELKVYPTTTGWSWSNSIDVTDYASWSKLNNVDTTWEEGAFGQNGTGHPNYGWGVYDEGTHNITGVALYIIKLTNGTFKKLWIEKKYSSLQKYSLRFANTDGTDEVVVDNLTVSDSKANFVYYNLATNTRVDREPDAATWDLVFTKWVDNSINYVVTGVLQNVETPAIDITTDTPTNIEYTNDQFSTNINIIGSDWKSFNMGTNQWSFANKVFVVKDKANKVYKIQFTGFEGSATGNLTFNIEEL